MIKWITKINWGKAILLGAIYTVIAMVVRSIEAMFTMKYYLMPQYFGVWSHLMMPSAGPPPSQFYITSLVFSFASGIMITLVYYYLRDLLPKGFKKRVFLFADLLIGSSFIFFTLPVYLMFNVPAGLLVSWFVSSFIIIVLFSWVIVKVIN